MATIKRITKIKINSDGVAAVMKSGEVTGNLAARAQRISAALPRGKGEEWEVVKLWQKDRGTVMVKTANYQAKQTNARINALTNALTAGR